MDEKETFYAVLLSVNFITDEIVCYMPEYLIEGTIKEEKEERYFVGKYDIDYSIIEDFSIVENKEDFCVGYLISKNDLKTRYKEVPIDQAEKLYLNEISSEMHFGIYAFDEDYREETKTIDLEEVSFMQLLANSSDGQVEYQPQKTIYFPDTSESIEESTSLVFEFKEIEDMLQSGNLEELKNKLQNAYEQGKRLIKYAEESLSKNFFDDESLIDTNLIKDFFNTYYQKFIFAKDLQEIKYHLEEFESNLLQLIEFIQKTIKDYKNPTISLEENILYEINNTAKRISSLENLETIQEEIEQFYKENNQKIEQFLKKCQKNIKKDLTLQKKETTLSIESAEFREKLHVRKIKQFLDEFVVGQENAKRRIISAVVRNFMIEDSSYKNTCLLIGPTGSGKTLIVKTLCKYFNIPMVTIDSTQLTQAGYKGADPEQFLERLLIMTNGDKEKAERGIAYFDEIDKKALEDNEVSGKSVLDMLLLFIEGTTYNVSYKNRMIPFDTTNLTIIASGSFSEMVRKMNQNRKGYRNTRIGFHTTLDNTDIKQDILYPKITDDDLREYGNLPEEILGRMPVIVQLDGHTKESLRNILYIKTNALEYEKKVFEKMNVELTWTEEYLDKVVEKAIALKQGGRSLKKIIEESIYIARDEVNNGFYEGKDYQSVVLTENTVFDGTDCIFITSEGISINLKEIICGYEECLELDNNPKKIKKI